MLNLPLQVCLVSTVQVLLHLFPDSDPEQISLVMKGTMLVLSCNADLNSPSSLRTNSLLILIRFWTEMRKWKMKAPKDDMMKMMIDIINLTNTVNHYFEAFFTIIESSISAQILINFWSFEDLLRSSQDQFS